MNVLEKMNLEDDLTVKSTGFNQWDEEWEVGGYNAITGKKVDKDTTIRSTNHINVFPSTTYYVHTPQNCYVLCYNASGTLITKVNGNTNFFTVKNNTFTTPTNCYSIAFEMSENYGTTYNHDICINLSDSSKNGTYLPYTTSTQGLSWIYDLEYIPEGSETPEKLFPYGLLSAGSVHDEITDTVAVKRIGSVDLGTLNWIKQTEDVFITSIPEIVSNYYTPNLLCPKYTTHPILYTSLGDKEITNRAGYTSVYIRDSAYTDAAAFKAAMSGVILYYELAVPITVTFDSPKSMGYNVQGGGTEELLPTNPSSANPITAPVILSVVYPLDAVGTLVNLPKTYISTASMDSFTIALGNFLNANITKSWDSTNNKYNFTVTARS